MTVNVKMRKAVDLSFAGCGFLGMFHIGSLAAFRGFSKQGDFFFSFQTHQLKTIVFYNDLKYIWSFDVSVDIVRYAGASSGALVACAGAAGLDTSWLRSVFTDLVSVCGQHRWGPWSKNFDVEIIIKVEELFSLLTHDHFTKFLLQKSLIFFSVECVRGSSPRYSPDHQPQIVHLIDKYKIWKRDCIKIWKQKWSERRLVLLMLYSNLLRTKYTKI